MRFRIPLIVFIVAGLAVTALNFFKITGRINNLHAQLRQETAAKQTAEAVAAAAQKQLAQVSSILKETKTELQAAQAARDEANASLMAQVQRADKLGAELASVGHDRDKAQVDLGRYQASGLTPQQAANAIPKIQNLEREIAFASAKTRALAQEVTQLKMSFPLSDFGVNGVRLPATLQGKVLVWDPKWRFVVLDAGQDQGVLESGELLVNRDGKLVAKVKVDRVEKDRSIASVMPGWQLAEIIEGDRLVPAHPDSF